MSKSLSILYVAAEAFPFAKETSVADVAGGFPIALHELGHDIRAIIPRYGVMSDRRNKIHCINRMSDINIDMPSGKQEPMTIKSTSIFNTRTKVQFYVVCNQKYFETKKGIYHDPIKWIEYSDNLERFAYFSRAVVEACVHLGWYPDIIHCNDWQTALIPAFIRYYYPQKFRKTKSILTIHNMASQGSFPLSMFDVLGLPEDAKDTFTHKKRLNILKGGMIYANKVTTISQAYKDQIAKDKDITDGLHTLIKLHYNKIEGINNGIDVNWWNPRKDNSIHKKLGDSVEEYKTANKIVICKSLKLEYKEDIPLICMINRIDKQKGVDVLIDAIPELMKLNIQLVIIGTGERVLKEELSALSKMYPKKLTVVFKYDDALIHQIKAGADMCLMSARQETTNLNMLYSLAYGTIPIAHLVGGIKDNAMPFKKNITEETNCFEIKKLDTEKLLEATINAITIFKNKEIWNQLTESVMQKDYTWTESVKRYNDLYRRLYKDEY